MKRYFLEDNVGPFSSQEKHVDEYFAIFQAKTTLILSVLLQNAFYANKHAGGFPSSALPLSSVMRQFLVGPSHCVRTYTRTHMHTHAHAHTAGRLGLYWESTLVITNLVP